MKMNQNKLAKYLFLKIECPFPLSTRKHVSQMSINEYVGKEGIYLAFAHI